MNLKFIKNLVIIMFVMVPISSATISTFHLKSFLALGNDNSLAWATSITYELANICTILVLTFMHKIKKAFIWTSFCLLVSMQVIGNIYYSYDYISNMIIKDGSWITNFIKMMNAVISLDLNESILYLSIAIGAPVPIIALLLSKSLSEYLADEEKITEPKKEEPAIERQPENIRQSLEIVDVPTERPQGGLMVESE